MSFFEGSPDQLCAIYVDMGTTNTRVWFMHGREVLARVNEQVGVRDSAREGTTDALRAKLKELIALVQYQATLSSESCAPVCVVAAGMIGSPLGLVEVPHVPAPAGPLELSAATCSLIFPEVAALPFLLVPGVRSGSLAVKNGWPNQGNRQVDVMRGEETLCVGLHALGQFEPPAVVLTLGSHWKAIQIGEDGRIRRSVTSLSGEMIHAVQTQTILAGAIGRDWPERMAPQWLEAGMTEQRHSGLSRALFCVRLLELERAGTAEDRFAFLVGAFIATDLDALVARGVFARDARVVICGHAAMAEAWACALKSAARTVVVVPEEDTEQAFLAGLNRILIETISSSESTKHSAGKREPNGRS